ncbi:MAG: hypothetical protein Q8K60_00390 [Parachlamydiaceae bacterium]|nr:hypothetical protein [Parachlamydiaceae bacterium]
MKKKSIVILNLILGLALTGGLMADKPLHETPFQWKTFQDKKSGIEISFPHTPLEMSFEVPFQNSPPRGIFHFYSEPTPAGLFALSIFHSEDVSDKWLNQSEIIHFFKKILVPHVFYHPKVFENQQHFDYQLVQDEEEQKAIFTISFIDHEVEKKLKGIAIVRNQFLYIPFYLASAAEFDPTLFDHFIQSLSINK